MYNVNYYYYLAATLAYQDPLLLSKVTDGEIKNNSKARIIRDGKIVYDGQITSIFREKNAAKEVKSGLECGITFKNFLDFKEKDMIESYKVDMIERQIND